MKRKSRKNTLRCYAAFVNGRPDERTIRYGALSAKFAGESWNKRGIDSVRVVTVSWRKG